MSIFNNNLLAGAAAQGGTTPVHTIDQSIRFNSAEKAFITQDSGGSFVKETTSTISMWVKRAGYIGSGTANTVYGAFYGNNGRYDYINFNTSDQLVFGTRDTDATTANGNNNPHRVTTQVFRDPSAWYHIVVNLDSTNAVASERIRIYVNGARITDFATETTIPQNRGFYTMSDGVENNVGAFQDFTTYNQNLYFDGYLAEVALIDGTAYGPENFGEYNSSNIWIPKDISGLTFGSNGIYYKGQNASALGDDSSGNTNDGTVRNLAAHDQVFDTPTNNFATINSVYADNAPAGNAGTLSNGNLQYVGGGSTFSVKGLTFNLPKSGKWYFEYMIGGNLDGFGFVKQGEQGTINASNGPGQLSVAQGGGIQNTGWRNGGSNTTTFADSNTGSPFTAGFIHQVAIDVDNGKFYYGVKNTYYAADGGNDGNPSAGTNHMSTFAFSTTDVVLLAGNYSGTQYWNFGQDGTFSGQQTAQGNSDANGVGNFYYAPPTGYLALCTKNVGS